MSNFFNKTPYTDFHELNLDWLLERVNNIKDHVKGMQDDIIYLQEHTPDMDDYYDKTETDTLLANKADISSLATVATTGDYDDLINKPSIPAAQVNSDWNANSGVAQILNKPTLATVATSGSYNDLLNKPTIPAAQVNSDWNANSGVAQILNKPTLATVATSGDFNDLINNGSWSTPSANGWNYYTDPFGYRHWFRRSIPYTLNFNISQGSVYLTDVDTWTLNTDISKLIFADIHCECNDRLVTGQIQGFTSTQLKTFYYSQTSGTSTIVVNLHLVFRP